MKKKQKVENLADYPSHSLSFVGVIESSCQEELLRQPQPNAVQPGPLSAGCLTLTVFGKTMTSLEEKKEVGRRARCKQQTQF